MPRSKTNRLSVRLRVAAVLTGGVLLMSAVDAKAGFEITSFSLFNLVRDSSGPSSFQDVDRITDILNPLQQTSTAQLGNNIASSTYDYSWLEDIGIGDFNTTISHTMRNSPNITTVTSIRLFIETDVDLMVSLNASLDYSHTPGDETQFLFGMFVTDIHTQEDFFDDAVEGGNADLLPASGTLTIDSQFIIPANRTYFFGAALTSDNFDEDSAGIYDANGFANISIRPVPEPQALLLVLIGASTTILRRPR